MKTIRVVMPEDLKDYTAKARPVSNIWESSDCLKQVYQDVKNKNFYLLETPRNSNYCEGAEEISNTRAAKLVAEHGFCSNA